MTGDNRYAGGSKNWLLIRGIEKQDDEDGPFFVIKVRIKGQDGVIAPMYSGGAKADEIRGLKFKNEQGMPCSFDMVLRGSIG